MSETSEGSPEKDPAFGRERTALRRVLLVEDNEIDAEIMRALVRRIPDANWELHWAASVDEGLAILGKQALDVVLVDFWIGGKTGADFIHQARNAGHTQPMVVVTASTDPATDWHVFLAGASAYIPKDTLTTELLERTIRYALRDPLLPSPCALSGFVCICVDCRRLRDSHEHWTRADDYITAEPGVSVSHGLCPMCFSARMSTNPPTAEPGSS